MQLRLPAVVALLCVTSLASCSKHPDVVNTCRESEQERLLSGAPDNAATMRRIADAHPQLPALAFWESTREFWYTVPDGGMKLCRSRGSAAEMWTFDVRSGEPRLVTSLFTDIVS
jgi:hypothetical protein